LPSRFRLIPFPFDEGLRGEEQVGNGTIPFGLAPFLVDAAWDLYQKVEMEIDDEKEKLPTEQMNDREFSFYLSQNDRENS
jgi:hypothetical protein